MGREGVLGRGRGVGEGSRGGGTGGEGRGRKGRGKGSVPPHFLTPAAAHAENGSFNHLPKTLKWTN